MRAGQVTRFGAAVAVALWAGACATAGDGNVFFGPSANFPAAASTQADTALSRGKLHFRNGDYGLAERHYREAVEQVPGDVEGWIGLAASYDHLKRFDLADRAYEQARRLSADSAMVLNNIGYSHLLRGDAATARGLFAQALARDPLNERIRGNIVLAEELAEQGQARPQRAQI